MDGKKREYKKREKWRKGYEVRCGMAGCDMVIELPVAQ